MPHHWNLCGYTECAAANPPFEPRLGRSIWPGAPNASLRSQRTAVPKPSVTGSKAHIQMRYRATLLSSPCRAAAVAALRISIHVDDRSVEVLGIAHDGRRPDPSRVSPNGLCVQSARGAATSGADARAGPGLACRVLFAALHESGAGRRSWALAMPLAARFRRHRTQHRRVRP